MSHHDDYMADHLDSLAESLGGPIPPSDLEFKRASLRGLAHVSRKVGALERDVNRLNTRVSKLEARDAIIEHLIKRVDSLEEQMSEKKNMVRGGWGVIVILALVGSTLIGAGWAVYAHYHPEEPANGKTPVPQTRTP